MPKTIIEAEIEERPDGQDIEKYAEWEADSVERIMDAVLKAVGELLIDVPDDIIHDYIRTWLDDAEERRWI